MLIELLFISLLFFTSVQQYQQTFKIAGDNQIDADLLLKDEDFFHSGNSPGGLEKSCSLLISEDSEILVFFGIKGSQSSDRIWKFSLEKSEWMLVKGRKENNQPSVFNEINKFEISNQIGSRHSTNLWVNQNIVSFFAGYANFKKPLSKRISNELWRYNITSNSYAVIREGYFHNTSYHNLLGYFTAVGEYSDLNIPAGRTGHEIIKLNEDEVFVIGGYGYSVGSIIEYEPSCEWYMFSTELMKWKVLGGTPSGRCALSVLGEKDVYDSLNTIGGLTGLSGLKINEEEVLIFGGKSKIVGSYTAYSNTVHKYNISSNMWKYVSGNSEYESDVFSKGFSRDYKEDNLPGRRQSHKLFKLNDNEALMVGGFFSKDQEFYYSDEWVFNFNQLNQWRFTGKQKLANRYISISNDQYSEDNLMGGLMDFFGHYISSKNTLFIGGGKGFGEISIGALNNVYEIYYGNMCNLLKDSDPNVCSKKGICINHDECDCFNQDLFGSNCEITKCNNIFSNDTENVCSGKGICINSKCLCYEENPYNNNDCTVNENLENFMNNLWVFIVIPVVLIILFLVFIIVFGVILLIILKQNEKLKKFEGIEDVDIILQEQKFANDSSIAHFNINKKLFEIDFKDIKVLKTIGSGGSSAMIYKAEWNGQIVAYKSFTINDFLKEDKYKEFEREVEILASVSFPFILNFFGATLNKERLGFVMEYAENGDLDFFLKKYKKQHFKEYPFEEKFRMLKEISSAMLYLHKKSIIHRDLKPQNILVTEKEETRLMDFGISKIISDEKTRTLRIGTSHFIAPEVTTGHYSFPCDVFSFSILMYVVLTGNFSPFGENSRIVNIELTIKNNPKFRPKIKQLQNLSNDMKNMIKRNWDHEPSKRMTFNEICQFFSKIEEDNKRIQKGKISSRKKADYNENLKKKILQLEEIVSVLKKENLEKDKIIRELETKI